MAFKGKVGRKKLRGQSLKEQICERSWKKTEADNGQSRNYTREGEGKDKGKEKTKGREGRMKSRKEGKGKQQERKRQVEELQG